MLLVMDGVCEFPWALDSAFGLERSGRAVHGLTCQDSFLYPMGGGENLSEALEIN